MKKIPRPRKWRKVCGLPNSNRYGPLDSPAQGEHFVVMTIDEYETIRLIDLEGLSQEECSNQMNVARTTVQGIYSEARKKIAESLVNGKVLRIEGGDYKLCDGEEECLNSEGCHRHRYGIRFIDGNDTEQN
ncbi:MAG: DUF134 domain-containing protein [Poseidonibacter sp.]|uniref:DUF134 domain-containing protein n=1 Tax=Poseidonibacter sp. TaxID=2321188 RepID=UPI00359EDE79